MKKELRLKPQDLTWLAQAFTDNSLISPFSLTKAEGFGEEDKKRLVEEGVIGEDNEIRADYFPMLDILAKADGYIQTTFKRGPVSADKIILTKGEEKASLVYQSNEAVVNMPADPQGMVAYLKDFMGGSKLTGSDLVLEADAWEALVFAVICDLYRKAVLKAYGEEEVFVYPGFTKQQLLEAVNSIRDNSQNLAYHIFMLHDGFEEAALEKIDATLPSLMGKGLVKRDGEYYSLQGEGLLFAGNFLIIENIIEVIVGQVKEDKLYRSNFLLLQAGPLDIVYFERSGDQVIMECMSAIQAAELLTAVLGEKPAIA